MYIISENLWWTTIILLIVVWSYEGFSLKFLDQIVDEHREVSKIFLAAQMIMAGLAAGFFMSIDHFTSGATLALILGMILSRKIDNRLWIIQIALVLIFYITFVFGFFYLLGTGVYDSVSVLIIFVVVLIFSIADEITHELIDKLKESRLKKILQLRLIMKIVVIILPFIMPEVEWYHSLAWLLFDFSYEITASSYNELNEKTNTVNGMEEKNKELK
ncbi:MAG: hypothetical protein ACTSVI_10660 [Promethearchaeota archaeon]